LSAVSHAVTDFVWSGERFVRDPAELDLAGAADPLASARELSGQFALHQVRGHEHVLARDALGVNKLFYAIAGRELVSSSYWIDIVRRCPGAAVWSVPSGHLVRVSPIDRQLRMDKHAVLPFDDGDGEPGPEHVARIRESLARSFRRLRDAAAGRPLFVTLSGGLDSTAIAVLARRHLGPFTAVTFSIDDGADARPTDDLRHATRVAAELEVSLLVVRASADELCELIDVALVYGQDWRDFNVHCALVNAAIGRAIAAGGGARPLLLTGDTMNELMADYTPVVHRGREYYPLPRMPVGRLRRFLVQGLDAGDREIGVFAHFGLDAIQPYAMCAEAYAAVPGGCLARPEAKQHLVRAVMGEAIPTYIYERPKVRAQAGGADEVRGTLAALVDRGIDAAWLERRFCQLFDLDAAALRRAIRAGFYRFTTSYPA
jgi:asparagine synthetase B (glutamine-hydrolysing)